MTVNNTAQIRRLLKVLGHDFAMSQNPNSRKGGLIGLAAISIALGRVSTQAMFFSSYRRISAYFTRIFGPPELSTNLYNKWTYM